MGVESQQQYAQTIGYVTTDPVSGKNNDPTYYKNTGNYNFIGAQTSNVNTNCATTSIFKEWNMALPQDFSITAGLGLSLMDIELNNRMLLSSNSTIPRDVKASYSDMISPWVALNKIFSTKISTYVSYSRGYKVPTSTYFWIPLKGILNSNLKPEKGDQIEIGTKGLVIGDKLQYQIALFNTLFTNKMTVVAVPNATNTATSYTFVANG